MYLFDGASKLPLPDASVGIHLHVPPGGVPGQAHNKEEKVKIFKFRHFPSFLRGPTVKKLPCGQF
jgi:hypothetical protein